MSISEPFIRRPIATSLLTLGLLAASFVAYAALPVAPLPEVDYPTIVVSTRLPGAGPSTMASTVTTPLEGSLGQIPSLARMSSVTGDGVSLITLQFELSRDIDAAEQDVQAALNAASALLPPELPAPPIYSKANPADAPILSIAIRSSTQTIRDVNDLADAVIAQRLSQVSGVGLVAISGGQRPAVRVRVDAQALASRDLTLEDLRTAIARANVHRPTGSLGGARLDYTLTTNDQLDDASEFAPVVVAYRNGSPIRLADVATVEDGIENESAAAFVDGRAAVVLDVFRQPGANILEVADDVKRALESLRATQPGGLTTEIVADRTETIRASFEEVRITLVFTVCLVVAVMYVFLRSLRATLIPGAAVPVSIVLTFGVMHFLGFSLNNLTLMALTIATGFVVDDAIVMVENAARLVEEGRSPFEAALEGARQIGFTIVSLTASLVAVLIPLLFMGGVVGRLFREFAVTLATSIVISAFVSLTLTAMMSARLLSPHDPTRRENAILRSFEAGMDGLLALYERALDVALRHRLITLALTASTLVITAVLAVTSPKGFFPSEDTGLLTGFTEVAGDLSFDAMLERQRVVAETIAEDPAVEHVVSSLGADTTHPARHRGRITVTLRPRHERDASADEVIARLRGPLDALVGVDVSLLTVRDLALDLAASPGTYQYTVEASDLASVDTWSRTLEEAMRERPELARVRRDTRGEGVARVLSIDRDAAARLGVPIDAIDAALYDAFGQRPISTIYTQLTQYRVILDVREGDRRSADAPLALQVRTAGGALVPLSALVRATDEPAPLVVRHRGELPAATLSFDTAEGVSLDGAIRAIDAVEAAHPLPSHVTGAFEGTVAEFEDALATSLPLVIAALLCVFVVLGVLYESVVHPITILSTLPSAGVGAFLALAAFGMPFDVVGLIGTVLLIGIVKKNAIMMIDFALEAERERGLSPEAAIREACRLRFRPITMTTVAALLGALPLAFGLGPLGSGIGEELRRPLGVTIAGGLLFSQVVTLLATPVVYLAMERARLAARRWFA